MSHVGPEAMKDPNNYVTSQYLEKNIKKNESTYL